MSREWGRMTPRVERLVRAYGLLETSGRRPTDPRVLLLQSKLHAAKAQLDAEELMAYVWATQRYRERTG
jgi:hypothetical protein